MSLTSIDKLLLDKKVWRIISFFILLFYLLPLFLPNLYVPVYDNLDSNVVWNKILAESGKIFAPNHAIIPNMMNGLPRASYSSEFDLLLWFYCFFTPKTAYIINEFLIHITAFFGMLLFLSKYIVSKGKYHYFLVYIGSIYFATLPFWSGAGITIASLPLTTFILLDIKKKDYTAWHWIYLLLLPLYSSLVLMYLFYIGFLVIYIIFDILKHKRINKPFLVASLLLTMMFILKEYRLFIAIFFDSSFVSHRTEFHVFFLQPFLTAYRSMMLQNFLIGFNPHLPTLQQLYIIPISVLALLLILKKKPFSPKISLILWGVFFSSFIVNLIFFKNIWTPLLTNTFTIPVIIVISLIVYVKSKRYRIIPLSLLFILFLSAIVGLSHYNELAPLSDAFPILKAFNITRASFVTPLLWTMLFVSSLLIFLKKLPYSHYFIFFLFLLQVDLAFNENFYQRYSKSGYLTFNEYYDTKLFTEIKRDLIKLEENKTLNKIHVVNYGIEPAVALYNGLYTIDGYSANYPLFYKKAFRMTQAKELLDLNIKIMKGNRELYDNWGSKLYLLAVNSEPESYKYYAKTNTNPQSIHFVANHDALCKLDASYVLSTHPLKNIDKKLFILKEKYKGDFWRVWLYKIKCN